MFLQNTISKMHLKEKQQRLNGICHIMDTDEDGFLQQKEIEVFINKAQEDLLVHDQRSQWFSYDKNMDQYIDWDEWKATMDEFLENSDGTDVDLDDEELYDY